MKRTFEKYLLGIAVFFMLGLVPLTSLAATPGKNLSTAGSIGLNTKIKNTLQDDDRKHYYRLTLNTGYVIRFSLTTKTSNQSAGLTLYDSTGEELNYVYTEDASNWGYESVNLTESLTAGTYYLLINSYDYKEVNYTLIGNVLVTESATRRIAGRNNGYRNRAVSFSPGQSLTGVAYQQFNLMDWDAAHYYVFTVRTAGVFKASASASFLYTDETDMLWIHFSNASGSSLGKTISLSGRKGDGTVTGSCELQLSPGTYYISATSPDNNVLYTLSTSFRTAAPAVASTAPAVSAKPSQSIVRVKVSFKANGGKISRKSKKVTANGCYGKLPVPKRKGYKFLGWYTKKHGGRKIKKSTRIIQNQNHALYAHWKKK